MTGGDVPDEEHERRTRPDDDRDPDESPDPLGLAPERTDLAWTRTIMAVAASLALLARSVTPLLAVAVGWVAAGASLVVASGRMVRRPASGPGHGAAQDRRLRSISVATSLFGVAAAIAMVVH